MNTPHPTLLSGSYLQWYPTLSRSMCLRAIVPNLPAVSLRLITGNWHFWNPELQTLAMVSTCEGLLFLDHFSALIVIEMLNPGAWAGCGAGTGNFLAPDEGSAQSSQESHMDFPNMRPCHSLSEHTTLVCQSLDLKQAYDPRHTRYHVKEGTKHWKAQSGPCLEDATLWKESLESKMSSPAWYIQLTSQIIFISWCLEIGA